jgi:hypothetical protein
MEERNVDEGEYSEGNEEDDDMIVRSEDKRVRAVQKGKQKMV